MAVCISGSLWSKRDVLYLVVCLSIALYCISRAMLSPSPQAAGSRLRVHLRRQAGQRQARQGLTHETTRLHERGVEDPERYKV